MVLRRLKGYSKDVVLIFYIYKKFHALWHFFSAMQTINSNFVLTIKIILVSVVI
jgi:hypothetical protein